MPAMTSKGQVTIPKTFRDYLGLKPGNEVSFDTNDKGEVIVKPATRRSKSRFAKLRARAKGQFTTEEIMRLTRGEDWPRVK
jgi:AbrB family looped-hinge helix DNA binding protein